MADALVAQNAGKQYQAWMFWDQAAKLLLPGTDVVEVHFEDGVRAFDDIVVCYAPLHISRYGERISHTHYQAKYHIGPSGAFTTRALTDPAFIGAEKATLLSRLGDAYRILGDEFLRREFWIISPWAIHPDDPEMRDLWRENTQALDLDVLRQGKQRNSRWVNLRAEWRNYTGAADEDELLAILGRLRIGQQYGGIAARYAEILSDRLYRAGLKAIDPHAANEPYSQIPWNLHAKGRTRYTRQDIEAIAEECELRIAAPEEPAGRRLGIRTRVDWGAEMETQCAAVLPLEDLFERRALRDGVSWTDVYQRIHPFVRTQTAGNVHQLLELSAPITVAFAAGYALPTREGRPVYPLQRRRAGIDLWKADNPDATRGGWTVCRDEPAHDGGRDLALGLGLSREVWAAMRGYVAKALPSVGRVVELQPETGCGLASVKGPGHAVHLAMEAEHFIRGQRGANAVSTVHLFLAVPNAFAFFLGQEGERLGRCQLYEFDFPGEQDGSYWPSLLIPDHTR